MNSSDISRGIHLTVQRELNCCKFIQNEMWRVISKWIMNYEGWILNELWRMNSN